MKFFPFFMITIFPSIFLFLIILGLGRVISISSCHWLFVWVGLEINLLSFIPLIKISRIFCETESATKYFLVQALGSGFILLGSMNIFIDIISILSRVTSSIFLIVGLIIKLGAAPFHFWFPPIVIGINWWIVILLITWQKIAPFIVLRYLFIGEIFDFIIFFIRLGALIGGIIGINQTHLRALLAYSSISHIRWVLGVRFFSLNISYFYFLIYLLISFSIIVFIIILNFYKVSFRFSLIYINRMFRFSIGLIFLSLGGIPPFIGFFPKIMVVMELGRQYYYILIVILIIGSLFRLFYYLVVCFNRFLFINFQQIYFKEKFLNIFYFFIFRVFPVFLIFIYALTFFYKS